MFDGYWLPSITTILVAECCKTAPLSRWRANLLFFTISSTSENRYRGLALPPSRYVHTGVVRSGPHGSGFSMYLFGTRFFAILRNSFWGLKCGANAAL